MKRIIFHVDVNNAFLSWTAVYLLNHGYPKDIRTIPSIIGGDEEARKGVVLAKSPVAKKYGIVTAETLYSARKKCPMVKTFPANYAWYKEESKKLMKYLSQYTPVLEQFSIDECFLDMSGMERIYGNDYVSLAHKIKDEIKNKFGFTVNIGIGENKLCAKMASDFEKPDKVHTLFMSEIKEKMWPLPVDDLFMLGKKSASKLHSFGIHTIGDLAQASSNLLTRHFKSQGLYFQEASRGIDTTPVMPRSSKNKCISVSRTLPYDFTKREELERVLFQEVEEVSFQLRKQKLYTKTIAITYRNNLFQNYSHQLTLLNPTNSTKEIYKQVLLLFDCSYREDPIRNIGVRLSDFSDHAEEQLSLFDTWEKRVDDPVEKVMDSLKEKFGENSIMRASSKEEKNVVKKNNS